MRRTLRCDRGEKRWITWIVVVPAAFVLARFTGLGIVSVYFLVQATELIKVVIGYRMVRSNVWLVQMV